VPHSCGAAPASVSHQAESHSTMRWLVNHLPLQSGGNAQGGANAVTGRFLHAARRRFAVLRTSCRLGKDGKDKLEFGMKCTIRCVRPSSGKRTENQYLLTPRRWLEQLQLPSNLVPTQTCGSVIAGVQKHQVPCSPTCNRDTSKNLLRSPFERDRRCLAQKLS
jgi:hypothetical protein